MSKYPQSIPACMASFEKMLRADPDLEKRTVRYYVEQAQCAINILQSMRPDILPQNITKADAITLLDYMRTEDYAIATQKNYLSGIKKFSMAFNNYALADYRARWPQDTRPNVDWLSFEEAKLLLESDKTANQELIVHLELCMGFRRCEVARMIPAHIHQGYVDVIGKGCLGGKLRIGPFHPRSSAIFDMYAKHRQDLRRVAEQRRRVSVDMPPSFLIYERSGRLNQYSDIRLTGLDGQLIELRKDLGLHFSNHTLRRTFGRTMFHSGVPIPTISKLLGHEDTGTTIGYLGLDLDDMSAAMSAFTLR